MITIDFDAFPLLSSQAPPEIEAAVEGDATAGEIKVIPRGVATEPTCEWLGARSKNEETSAPTLSFELPVDDWTEDRERAFAELAGREAIGLLSATERTELIQLLILRRKLKNPRSGEELLAEYEQREFEDQVTHELVGTSPAGKYH